MEPPAQGCYGVGMADLSKLSPGQRAYEEKRARKAGMSLEKWLDAKAEEARAAERAQAKAAEKAAKTSKKPGFFARLIERAHKPL